MKTPMYYYYEGREKRALPSNEALEKWLDPADTAVVSIDMHRGHIGPEDEGLTCPAPRAREAISAHNAFHAHCRELGIPVIIVQNWQRHGGIDGVNSKHHNRGENWRVLYELNGPPNPLMDEHSWEGTPWLDLLIEHDPERDYYVRKKRLSSFHATDLNHLLHQLGVHNIVITGVMTDACDLSTAYAAADLDFRVLFPRDVAGRCGLSEESEDSAMMVISHHVGLVVDSPALLAEWYAREGRDMPADLAEATNSVTSAR